MPSEPTARTIKALFILAGNKCAFPRCTTPNYDRVTQTVLGEIAHIRARQVGGPRYVADFDDVHSLPNLIVLCGVHHKMVDDNPERFSVESLVAMKAEHERLVSDDLSGSDVDHIVARLTPSVTLQAINSPVSNSVVVGGDVGGNVTVGAPPEKRVEWWRRQHAPRFQLHPGMRRPQVQGGSTHYNMEATLSAPVAELRYRWRGGGAGAEWLEPPYVRRDHVRLKPVDVRESAPTEDPELEPGQMGIEFEFYLDGEECHYLQIWEIAQGPVAPGDERFQCKRW